MSGHAELTIRPARVEERDALEELQRRASLALGEYNEQLEADPDAVQLPQAQIERGEVMVAELRGRIAGFAAVIVDRFEAEIDGLFVEPELWRKGIGGSHSSNRTGTSVPRSQPSLASAATQSESTEWRDQTTTTQRLSASAASISRVKRSPARSRWSNHTDHPRCSPSASASCLTRARSSRA